MAEMAMEEHTIGMAEMTMQEHTMAMTEMMKGEAITDDGMAEAMTVAAAMTADPKYNLSHKEQFFLLFFGCKVWRVFSFLSY
jgi:hypothetical protein